MEIKRDAYLQQLIERKDNGMIKVITGIRRCGKSFLLFTIFKRYLLENGVDVDHIIEIALDGIENEELRDPKVCFKYIKDAMKDESLYELVRVNVRKVDGNGSPLKNAVFGIYDSEEAAKKEDVALARLTTGADGLSQEGGARK